MVGLKVKKYICTYSPKQVFPIIYMREDSIIICPNVSTWQLLSLEVRPFKGSSYRVSLYSILDTDNKWPVDNLCW